MKIELTQDSVEEFIKSVRPLWFEFLKEDGCANFQIYREFEKENTFCLVGEYETNDSMTKHFRTSNFEVLIGAASVLGSGFKIQLSEVFEKGGLEKAKILRKR